MITLSTSLQPPSLWSKIPVLTVDIDEVKRKTGARISIRFVENIDLGLDTVWVEVSTGRCVGRCDDMEVGRDHRRSLGGGSSKLARGLRAQVL